MSSPLDVAANHSQLRGSCPDFTFLVAVFSPEANFHLQQGLFEFLGAFCSFSSGFSFFSRVGFLSTPLVNEPFGSEQAIQVFQNGLI